MNASVDLDNSIRGKEDARRVGVPAGLDLVSRTWKVEEHVTRRHALQYDVSAAVQLQSLADIENERV